MKIKEKNYAPYLLIDGKQVELGSEYFTVADNDKLTISSPLIAANENNTNHYWYFRTRREALNFKLSKTKCFSLFDFQTLQQEFNGGMPIDFFHSKVVNRIKLLASVFADNNKLYKK